MPFHLKTIEKAQNILLKIHFNYFSSRKMLFHGQLEYKILEKKIQYQNVN